MILGKVKRHPDDPESLSQYVAHAMVPGDNNNLLCMGAPGSWKSRGFIIPFLMGCTCRGESAFITDVKGELFERLSPYFREKGFYVKAVNFGALPNNSAKEVEYADGDTTTRTISCSGTMGNGYVIPGATGSASFPNQVLEIMTTNTKVGVITHTDRSNTTAVMVVKYWRTSD